MSTKRLFAAVGTRFPMDRLLSGLDNVLDSHSHIEAQAQIGNSAYKARHLKTQQWMSEAEFESQVKACDIFVSHAGMGNILLAAQLEKPIIVMPRRAELKEHINDHQIATAEAVRDKPFVHVVNNDVELEQTVIRALESGAACFESINVANSERLMSSREQLVKRLREFIADGKA